MPWDSSALKPQLIAGGHKVRGTRVTRNQLEEEEKDKIPLIWVSSWYSHKTRDRERGKCCGMGMSSHSSNGQSGWNLCGQQTVHPAELETSVSFPAGAHESSVFHKMNTNPSKIGLEERQSPVHPFPCVLADLFVLFLGGGA